MFFIPGPLEQFEISPLLSLNLGNFLDLSITNALLITLLGLSLFYSLTFAIGLPTGSPRVLKQAWQYVVEGLILVSAAMLSDNVGKEGEKFYPFIFSLFSFVVIANLIGLVPYSFTITSHLIVTFSLAIIVFVGVNIVGVQKHGIDILCLFLPGGTSIALAFLLVPIELISYIFKPISLSVRLFANMMAGHTLLKVIAGFAWSMLSAGGLLFIFHTLPLAIIVILMGLELGVALIQAYVFSILSCIYLNDTLNMH